MSWMRELLGNLVDFIDGDRGPNYPKKHEFSDSGDCLFLDTSNVAKTGFDFNNVSFISKEKDEILRKGKIQRGDIVLTTRGTLGNVGYYSDLVPFDQVRINSGMLILRAKSESQLLPEFLFYWLQSQQAQGQIVGARSGSAQPQLPVKTLFRFQIDYPSLDEQRTIVQILSTYDSLIENNRKQIKLLEEAAQRLYKEWFIDLRFPGYETTAIDLETGLPEGWSRIALGEYAEFRRGKAITEKQTSLGTVPVVAGGLGPAYFHDTSNTTAPVITISGSGANAGFTRLYNEDIWASDCSYIDSTICKTIFFVYETVLLLGNGFKHLQRGSAQPHVYPKNVNDLEMALPSERILDDFEEIASILFFEIRVLEKQCKNATETRDRLLPMLMSNEIEA